MFQEAFESTISTEQIDQVIRHIFEDERAVRRENEPGLVNELYRMASFDWGGLHQNSLEKTIVDNYVKKIRSYEVLCTKIENELHQSMRGYVLCSWYNHWTSIIIEDIFKEHPHVLPAVGLVQKIDFFIRDVPFDLKVTYMPEGFISDRRRLSGLRPELTLLRQRARALGIHFDGELAGNKLLEDLWKKLHDHPDVEAQQLVDQLREFRTNLLTNCVNNPISLIQWLYENQGIRRFDASNRLFLVLVDSENMFESWKLKRARPLLLNRISNYLDSVGERPGRDLTFVWDETTYSVLSDVVFVIHP